MNDCILLLCKGICEASIETRTDRHSSASSDSSRILQKIIVRVR